MQQPAASGTSASRPEDAEDIQAAWQWPLHHFDWGPAPGGGAPPQQLVPAVTAGPPPRLVVPPEASAGLVAKLPTGKPPSPLEHGPHPPQEAQAAPAQPHPAVQAPHHHQAYSQPQIFHTAASRLNPPQHLYNHQHFGAMPMQAMPYGQPARLPMSMEQSMHLFVDSQMTQVASCTLIMVLGLLTGILLFFFVFRLGLSVRNGLVTTTAASDYDIVVYGAAHGQEDVTATQRHGSQPSREAVARAYNLAVASEQPLNNHAVANESGVFFTTHSQ
ncbi:hypothetical protein V5799_027987 [Amblyomma americanum]|uniref:Uncharacterized protein n=1 Tax=Amblyomma americanum TaxID=6943 RepID=A0AAQ4DE54_AMBAM